MQEPINNTDEISLKELIQKVGKWFTYFKSKWKIIFMAGIIGGLLGLGYAFMQKPLYKANLTFAFYEKDSKSGLGSIASQFGLGGLAGGADGGVFSGYNMLELLKSRFLVEKTLLSPIEIKGKKELLVNRYIKFNKLDKKWAKDSILKGVTFNNDNRTVFTEQQNYCLRVVSKKVLKENLEVTKIEKKVDIVSINVNSNDQLFAKLFSENLAKTVTDFYIETKTSKSRKDCDILQRRVDSVTSELNAAMSGRAKELDQNFGIIRQQAAVPRLRNELKVQMLTALYGELVKNLEFSKLSLMREAPLIQIIDRPILPLEFYRISKGKAIFTGIVLTILLSVIFLVANRVYFTWYIDKN
jgi:uncharacterized protein involved in exopolysaccharide biosynthesis